MDVEEKEKIGRLSMKPIAVSYIDIGSVPLGTKDNKDNELKHCWVNKGLDQEIDG